MKERIVESVMCAIATATYFAVILPLQSYLANAESFSYGLGPLIGECIVCWLVLLALVAILNYYCTPKLGRVTHLAFLVAIVLVMLESGPLAIGLPELNGEFEGYRSAGRTVLDYSVLLIALVTPWIFYRRIAPFIAWISAAIIVYSVATVFDVRRTEKHEVEGIDQKLVVPRDVVVNSAEFSAEDNVIVLILDATSQFVVQDIFRDSKLASRYEGFVNYVNNVGMHWNTSVGIPGLMTGKYYENALELPQYGKTSYGKDSFAYAYLERDIPTYVNVGPGRNGCCNRPIAEDLKVPRTDQCVLARPMFGQFELSLAQLCMFRLLPYGLKERYLQQFIKKRTETASVTDAYVKWRFEPNLYPRFAAKGVSKTVKRTLHVHHTESGHPPIIYDENGKSIVCEKAGYAEYRAQCKNAFRCAAELFDVWKTNGVYDASTIIMAADHSASATFNTPGVDLHGADPHAFPFLMVKPKGARTAYDESDMPTSHCRIAEVVRTLADRILNRKEIESILVQTNRLVRLAQNGSIIEWMIDQDRRVKRSVRPDREPSIKELKPLTTGVEYSFRIDSGSGVYPDFVVENGNRNVTTGLAVYRNPMRFRFRVEDSSQTYHLLFSGKARATHFPTNRIEAVCGGVTNESTASTYTLKPFDTAFDDVHPDAEGVIECLFACDDIGYANYVLNGLKISVQEKRIAKGGASFPDQPKHGILCLSFNDRRSISSWVESIPLFSRYGARCSFFPNGELSTNHIKSLLKLYRAGHDVGTHTLHHRKTIELLKEIDGDEYLKQEITPHLEVLKDSGIHVKTFSYPFNYRSLETDQFLLTNGFKRLRASVGDYSKQLDAGIARENMDNGFTNAQYFADVKVVRAFPINTNVVVMLKVLDRAAKNNEFVGMYSHAISSEHSNDVPKENLEIILKHAKELGMEFRTLAD